MSENDKKDLNQSTYSPVPVPNGYTFDANKPAATGKVMIGSMDDSKIVVTAQYNPKELEISRSVPWSKPAQANRSNKRKGGGGSGASSGGGGAGGGDGASGGGGIHLEFTGAEGRSLTLELLFDGYESTEPEKIVSENVANLEKLARVRDPGATTEDKKRPHRCMVVWGSMLPSFQCVIEALSVKYTMFSPGGQPLRATCTVKLKEADIVSVAKKK